LTLTSNIVRAAVPGRKSAAFYHHPDYLHYDFGPQHPFRPERIEAAMDLLRTTTRLHGSQVMRPHPAEARELELVHSAAYIRVVDEAGSGGSPSGALADYGLTQSDNPAFPDMHYAASLVVGGTLHAARAVMNGDVAHAFNAAGGLHHAQRARASGFCIYNDAAVAMAALVRELDARILYLDFDCHHGDGVQWIFYDDPRVLTVSLHESGRYLFPGTGDESESGEGAGAGYCVNVPFMPFSRDSSWLEAVELIFPLMIERFRPDVVFSNHGCDTHDWDPLTHLSLTTESLRRQAILVHDLAHSYCEGRWVAVGSGGYDWRRVVPRSWTIVWCVMTEQSFPDRLPADWCDRWSTGRGYPEPRLFLDSPEVVRLPSRADEVDRINRKTLERVRSIAGLDAT
jgi:acetoin utilization protein AcuC